MRIRLRRPRHVCPTLPQTTPVLVDLPCRCGWHVTVHVHADTEGAMLMRMRRLEPHKLSGPVEALLDHYDMCETQDYGDMLRWDTR